MAAEPRPVLVVSDFNVETLCGHLAHGGGAPALAATSTDFGQALPALLDPAAPCWSPRPDGLVVWTLPEGVIASFARVLDGHAVEPAALRAEVEVYVAAIRAAAGRVAWLVVPTWATRLPSRAFPSLAMRAGVGLDGSLALMNAALVEGLAGSGAVVVDAARWLAAAPGGGLSAKRWYLAKQPFGDEVLAAAAATIRAVARGARGGARKLIVLDLDDTLWGGVVGDVGWEHLRLGGHDPIGEAYLELQRGLAGLRRRGVLLAVVSKNTEAIALEAIRRHPEMVLREADLVGWRIDWNDKAGNLADLVGGLGVGLDAVVFLDDNPVERSRVRAALPEVLVPEWPSDPLKARAALDALDVFDASAISDEDRARTALYAQEVARRAAAGAVADLEGWLAGLATEVTWAPVAEATIARVVQLLNKTNQMNLATRRLGEAELRRWLATPGCSMHVFEVHDRFGAAGLTGLVGLRRDGAVVELEDYVLSCRVMGRRIEEAMLHVAGVLAGEAGATILRATYRATDRNAPCLAVLRRSALAADAAGVVFSRALAEPIPAPAHVALVRR